MDRLKAGPGGLSDSAKKTLPLQLFKELAFK